VYKLNGEIALERFFFGLERKWKGLDEKHRQNMAKP
jgi:hypothetical protein